MTKEKKMEYLGNHPYKVVEKLMDVRYRRVKADTRRMSEDELYGTIQRKGLEKVDDRLYVKKTYENGIVVKIEELKFEYCPEDF